MKSKVFVLQGLVLTIIAITCIPYLYDMTSSSTVYAQEVPELPPPVPGDPEDPEEPKIEDLNAITYARDYKITEEEARQRLDILIEVPNLVQKIEENEVDYAATWIIHEPDLAIAVAFTTDNGAERLKEYLTDIEWSDIVYAEQSDLSHNELVDIQILFLDVANKVERLSFESGVFFPSGTIRIFTPTTDTIDELLKTIPAIQPYLAYFEVIYQEILGVDASDYSPTMPSGVHITTCTTGFVFKKDSTGKRYISTAGHCGDNQSSISTNLGNVVAQHQHFYDFQAHDIFSARGVGLTDSIKVYSDLFNVIGTEETNTLYNDFVCKYGKITGVTCGTITTTTFKPGTYEYPGFLKIEPSVPLTDLTCQGDSGGPVYKSMTANSAIAVGLIKGAPNADICPITQSFFVATPLDRIKSIGGYSVLTNSHTPHFYQNVFAANGNCTQYTGDINPNGTFSNWTSIPCSTYAPGTGTVTSYTNWVLQNKLHEGIWRGGKGYIREVPIKNNGTINWSAAPTWQQCCSGASTGGQGAYIVGDTLEQNVFQPNGTCTKYSATLNQAGDFTGWNSIGSCSTYAPGSGTVNSYTNWVHGDKLFEGMWRGGKGYVREVPINDNGTINWGGAPGWNQCCSGFSMGGQGAYVLWHQQAIVDEAVHNEY